VGKLVLLLADGTTLDVPLGKERMMIGRRPDNDICLPYPAVSGEHASVVTILSDSFLEDLGSTNGTLVNGRPIVKHFLRDHDQIDIGRQRMVFMSDDNARADPLPVDIVPNRLLGLGARVESASPAPRNLVPPAGKLPGQAANPRSLVVPDLEEALLEPLAKTVPRREAATTRSAFIERLPSPTSRESDRRLAAWAAEWAAPTGNTGTGTIDTSAVPIEAPRANAEAGTTAAAQEAIPSETTPSDPTVRVLSGPSLGREVPFNKDELSVGRVGVQVAVIRKVGDGFRLVPVEGAQPPSINGTPVAQEGAVLRLGDTFEVAGVRLELSMTG
jgi:pSer/pThr/pTyr-binding forkhead associated (FHA) protein